METYKTERKKNKRLLRNRAKTRITVANSNNTDKFKTSVDLQLG